MTLRLLRSHAGIEDTPRWAYQMEGSIILETSTEVNKQIARYLPGEIDLY